MQSEQYFIHLHINKKQGKNQFNTPHRGSRCELWRNSTTHSYTPLQYCFPRAFGDTPKFCWLARFFRPPNQRSQRCCEYWGGAVNNIFRRLGS